MEITTQVPGQKAPEAKTQEPKELALRAAPLTSEATVIAPPPEALETLKELMAEQDDTTEKIDKMVGDNIPKLSEQAMLLDYSISQWTARKLDRKASQEVSANKGAKTGVARVHKSLLGGTSAAVGMTSLRRKRSVDLLSAIHSSSSAIRIYIRDNTIPWGKLGERLVTNEQLIDFKNELDGMVEAWWKLVAEFVSVYGNVANEAPAELGALYNASDYPDVSQIKRKFGISVYFKPIPAEGVVQSLTGQTSDAIKDNYSRYYKEQIAHAMADVWNRVREPLENMSKMLDYKAEEKPTGFRDTLVDNVTRFAKLMKTCNITNDPEMDRVQREVTMLLKGVTPEALRDDPGLRLAVKKGVTDITKTIPSLDW